VNKLLHVQHRLTNLFIYVFMHHKPNQYTFLHIAHITI